MPVKNFKIPNPIPETGIELNQTQAAALLGLTNRTLREWEGRLPFVAPRRVSRTRVLYEISQLGQLSKFARFPIVLSEARKLELPDHVIALFYTKPVELAVLPLPGEQYSDPSISTRRVLDQIRVLAEGRCQTLPANLRAALRWGLVKSPEQAYVIASLLSSFMAGESD